MSRRTLCAQETQPGVAPGGNPEIYADAVNIYGQLAAMSEKEKYRSVVEYMDRVKSDQCAAINIAHLNDFFQELTSEIKAMDLPESVKDRNLARWQGMVTAQAAVTMIACDRGEAPPIVLELK